jgi:hypothetical protein
VKNFLAVLLVQILFSGSWSCTLLSQENRRKHMQFVHWKGLDFICCASTNLS